MKRVLLGILCSIVFNSVTALAANEPQTLDPKLDQALISKLKLWAPGTPVPDTFNILIIGQDDGAKSGRSQLSSRADIIMVISLNRITKKHNVLSVYRDHAPTAGCENRIGRAADGKINGVYSIQGRQGFIPCIEGMLEEMIAYLPKTVQNDVLDRSGRLKIHALFEGTRSQTVNPLGKDIMSALVKNNISMLSTYGMGPIGDAVKVLAGEIGGNGIAYLMGANPSEEEARKMVDPKYLSVELKERKVYPAGGYQRAFNVATVLTNILGWGGYGVTQWKSKDYNFLDPIFGAALNKNLSRSHDYSVIENQVFKRDGEHILTQTCFKNGSSPVRVIQWGESADTYAIYSGGNKMYLPNMNTMLKGLVYVDILPKPKNCN